VSVILEQAVVEKMSAAANRAESTGRSYPLGATIFPDGVNFSVFSRGASAVELLLFDREDDARPSRVIPIAPRDEPYVQLLARLPIRPATGPDYGYRVHGRWDPANGMRFDPTKVLLDPYAAGQNHYHAGGQRVSGEGVLAGMERTPRPASERDGGPASTTDAATGSGRVIEPCGPSRDHQRLHFFVRGPTLPDCAARSERR
jgi:pullulanase/glycogen debranching enzyme